MKGYKLKFLIILLLALFIPGCTMGKKSETKEKLNVFMDIKDSESIDLVHKLAEDYKNSNPGISINITSVLEKDTDVIFTTRANMPALADKGCLREVKNNIEENKIDERYYNIVKLYGRYNDKEYGIPVILNPLEVYYNEDSLKKNNLNIPADAPGLLKTLQELKSKSIEVPVIIPEKTEAILFSFIVNNTIDVSILDKNFNGGKEAYDNIAEMKIPFEILKDKIRKDIIGKSSFIKSGESAVSRLEKGEVPVLISLTGVEGNNIKAFQNYSKGIVPISSKFIAAISQGSENRKQADDFIKYLFSDETQKKLNEKGCITGNKAINKGKDGVEGAIYAQLEKADGKSIMYFDTIPDKLQWAVQARLELILSGKYSENEWNEIIKSEY